ncbi:MAG: VWA domain-containing protein [Puniceicoccaceae bacterium]
MTDFHFIRPLWLLAFVPVLILWWQIFRRQDALSAMQGVVDPHLLEHLFIGQSGKRWLRPVNMLLVLWLIIVVALAGPAWQREPSPFAGEDAGLVMLLKVSETMNAEDLQPNRLERAKFKLRDLLEERSGAPTALIVYSGSAHLVMPLTRDQRIISAMIEDLVPGLMPTDGDALGAALVKADSLLKRAGVPGSVVVLADSVSASNELAETTRLPVQFLAIQSPQGPLDPGMQQAASLLRGDITRLTVDSTDVQRIARRARSDWTTGTETGQDRWRDSGYAILPLIALCALFWSRKGWVTQ